MPLAAAESPLVMPLTPFQAILVTSMMTFAAFTAGLASFLAHKKTLGSAGNAVIWGGITGIGAALPFAIAWGSAALASWLSEGAGELLFVWVNLGLSGVLALLAALLWVVEGLGNLSAVGSGMGILAPTLGAAQLALFVNMPLVLYALAIRLGWLGAA